MTSTELTTLANNLKEIFAEVKVSESYLGGHRSVFVHASLDPKATWANGIYHNSRYSIFCLSDGKMEQISRNHTLPKFRKATIKDMDAAVSKAKAWVAKVVAG